VSILVNERSRVLVQGITGRQGSFHTRLMLDYGTRVVAGVTPGRGGETVHGVPVYDTVREAQDEHGASVSVVFVPAAQAREAVFEALDAGIGLLVVITEHIPLHDALDMVAFAHERGAVLVGPNTYGVVSPGRCKVGIPPNDIFLPGEVGVVSRSGTLAYQIVAELSAAGIGQSTVVGVGGDRVVGLSLVETLRQFERDEETRAVVLVGEIGGGAEEEAAEYIKAMTKPVVAYIAGRTAPPGRRMGHAGAIIERGRGSYESKISRLREAGAYLAEFPWEIPDLVTGALLKTEP